MGFAGLKAYTAKRAPLVQAYGTTYYDGEGPVAEPVVCKSKGVITAAIDQVHAKYDYMAGPELEAFEARAGTLKGLPPLNVEELYVVTEDSQLRNGEMVLFIGLKTGCVSVVFGLPAKLYRELANARAGA
jgi:hypothetical protein